MAEATTWTMDIAGWHPAPVNKLLTSHWSKAGKMKRVDKFMIKDVAMAYGIPVATVKRRVELYLVYAPKERAVDPDASWKSLLDALVGSGIIKNDSHVWVDYASPVVMRGPHRRCFITIQDVT